jgi:hypothetical protein
MQRLSAGNETHGARARIGFSRIYRLCRLFPMAAVDVTFASPPPESGHTATFAIPDNHSETGFVSILGS